MVLQQIISVPHPVEDNEEDLPYNPEENDLLAVLLRASYEAEVGEKAEDGGYKGGAWINKGELEQNKKILNLDTVKLLMILKIIKNKLSPATHTRGVKKINGKIIMSNQLF